MPQTVLIVDDDPVQRRLLEAMVRRAGYGTVVAEDGEAGLAVMRSGDPVALVILDLVMPGIDGFGVLAADAGEQDRHPGGRADPRTARSRRS